MSLIRKKYSEIRDDMQPGDVIAFSGDKLVSNLIKLGTNSEVSHVGVILPAKLWINEEPYGGRFNLVAESIASGVRIISLDGLQKDYKGDLWWLPLRCEARRKLTPKLDQFCEFLLDRDGREYDFENAIMVGLQELTKFKDLEVAQQALRVISILRSNSKLSFSKKLVEVIRSEGILDQETINTYFCSELVTEALRDSGVIGNVDPKTVTPIELCRFKIYKKDYVQFTCGEDTVIKKFNSKLVDSNLA